MPAMAASAASSTTLRSCARGANPVFYESLLFPEVADVDASSFSVVYRHPGGDVDRGGGVGVGCSSLVVALEKRDSTLRDSINSFDPTRTLFRGIGNQEKHAFVENNLECSRQSLDASLALKARLVNISICSHDCTSLSIPVEQCMWRLLTGARLSARCDFYELLVWLFASTLAELLRGTAGYDAPPLDRLMPCGSLDGRVRGGGARILSPA